MSTTVQQHTNGWAIYLKVLKRMVGTIGFEPTTSSVSRKRSNQLSYAPSVRQNTVYQHRVCAKRQVPPAGHRFCPTVAIVAMQRCHSRRGKTLKKNATVESGIDELGNAPPRSLTPARPAAPGGGEEREVDEDSAHRAEPPAEHHHSRLPGSQISFQGSLAPKNILHPDIRQSSCLYREKTKERKRVEREEENNILNKAKIEKEGEENDPLIPFEVAQFIEERNRGGAVSGAQKPRDFEVAQFLEPGAELERAPGTNMRRARLGYRATRSWSRG